MGPITIAVIAGFFAILMILGCLSLIPKRWVLMAIVTSFLPLIMWPMLWAVVSGIVSVTAGYNIGESSP